MSASKETNWFVVHTQSRQESIAQQHLQDQGYKVYVPRYKKITRHARKVKTVLAPLFPRYIFIAIDVTSTAWRSINGTRGVAYLLQNDGLPAEIPAEIIANLRDQEDLEGAVPLASVDAFVRGDRVRVLEGAFKDYTATYEATDDTQRVYILLSFLGRQTKICVPNYAIEAA